MTGWMLRISCVPACGPTLKLMLFWNGTLIRSPIGFCSFSASAEASSVVGGAAATLTWGTDG